MTKSFQTSIFKLTKVGVIYGHAPVGDSSQSLDLVSGPGVARVATYNTATPLENFGIIPSQYID